MTLLCDITALPQSFLIDRAGRKKLMGYGYLLMGLTMCLLTVMLSIKVTSHSPDSLCSVAHTNVYRFLSASELHPVREHRPHLLCHLHLWTWTL